MQKLARFCFAFAPLLFALVCPSVCAEPARKGRVIILGFDGVEPALVESMTAEGKLPNLAAVAAQGNYQRLTSTIPPQSPTAWTSFATSRSPGNHGVYDYVGRDASRYLPVPGVCQVDIARFLPDGRLERGAQAYNMRRGKTFWKVADDQGARCKVLHVPFVYPPDPMKHGKMLSGAGMPEVSGLSTYFRSFSTAFTQQDLARSLGGGGRVLLVLQEGKGTVPILPLREQTPANSAAEPAMLQIAADKTANTLTFGLGDSSVTVKEGEWSSWVEWTLPVTTQFAVRVVANFYVLEVGDKVRFYLSSLQAHPRDPVLPFTSPAPYAAELADRYGLYKTLGWCHDTTALRRDALDEEGFLEEASAQERWLETLTLDELAQDDFDLLIAVWTSTDRISHMFWRFRDVNHPMYSAEGAAKFSTVVEQSYERMDKIVGNVMTHLRPDDLLMVLSDHGFHSFRTGFNVNTWLLQNGYMVLQGSQEPVPAAGNPSPYYQHPVDWGRTRAYSMGMGGIYLNLRGREGNGIVESSEAPGLIEEIRQKLLSLTDPSTGDRVFTAIHTSDVFKGESSGSAPDLQLGYAEGYQAGKGSATGAVRRELFEPNLDKWSGEHSSSDVATTPGILFANVKLQPNPSILDLGVTALRYRGLQVPEEFEGRDLLSRDRQE